MVWLNLIPSVGMVFGLVSNRRQKPVPNTLLNLDCMDLIEVYRYIVYTVVDVVVQGAVSPLPHVGLQPVTFWMLQNSFARVFREGVPYLNPSPWPPPRITERGSATGNWDHVFSSKSSKKVYWWHFSHCHSWFQRRYWLWVCKFVVPIWF